MVQLIPKKNMDKYNLHKIVQKMYGWSASNG